VLFLDLFILLLLFLMCFYYVKSLRKKKRDRTRMPVLKIILLGLPISNRIPVSKPYL